jgi:uncharacterized repeat protein (TIGR03803 family)
MTPNGLVQGSDGNFYGTTYYGGAWGLGTAFKITPAGTLTPLYQFTGTDDGYHPLTTLVQGSDGNFYGMTQNGGTNYGGNVFSISPGGIFTDLYSFNGSSRPASYPPAQLVQGSDGCFYGITVAGTNGTVFKLSVPLNPPANEISSIQIDSSGTNLVLTIPSVAGETYQLQFSPSMGPANWVNVPSLCVSNSIGALLTLTNFGGAAGPQGFYRFSITP